VNTLWTSWQPDVAAALLHMIWQGAGAAVVLVLAHRLLPQRAARARYAAACAALFALPVIFAGTVLASHFWGAGLGAWVESQIVVLPRYMPWIVGGWVLGMVVMLAHSAGGWLLLRRARRSAVRAVPEEWRRRLADLCLRLGMGGSPEIGLSPAVDTPCVLGWRRPVILMPLSTLTGFPVGQLEALLAHELAHIRRHDYVVNLLQRGVEILFFYHPAIWWISRQVSEEREHCCDDIAVTACGDRLGYARTLLHVAECGGTAGAELACAAAGGSLPRRVRRIVSGELPRRRRGGVLAAFAMLGLGLWLVVPSQAPTVGRRPAAIHTELADFRLPPPARLRVAPPAPRPRPAARVHHKIAPVMTAAAAPAETAPPAPPRRQAALVAWTLPGFEACAPQTVLAPEIMPSGAVVLSLRTEVRCVPASPRIQVWLLTTT